MLPDDIKAAIEESLTYGENRRQLAARIAELAYQRGREDGYLLGFNASGEGWNGEYPFGDRNQKPEEDLYWLEQRAEAIEARSKE